MRRIYQLIDWLLGTGYTPPATERNEPQCELDATSLALATGKREGANHA